MDSESKVTVARGPDATSATYSIAGEDHTLGNCLRHTLMLRKDVSFCGYTMPHPSEKLIKLRLQTTGTASDEVMAAASQELADVCDFVLSKVQAAPAPSH